MSAEREEAIRVFLKHAGWGGAVVTPLPGDASTRAAISASRMAAARRC